jgi:RNA polymerase sigma-70 factor (ECF subfamily)
MAAGTATLSPRERETLTAARAGDETAYQRLVEGYRGELQAHCYRMLGSQHDAEDALQDALLRAWRALAKFEGRSSLRSWLYRIATNTCLDVIGRRPKRVLPIDYGPSADPHDSPGAPLTETVWIEPFPDETLAVPDGLASPEARYEQRESVELAFIAALQHLPPNQRAALILKDVLGFSAKEMAETLETSTASVNSALQRARATLDDTLPERSQQETLRSLGDEELRELVERYMAALQAGDVEAIVGLLAEDAAWSMPPCAGWFRGEAAVRAFLTEYPLRERWRHRVTRANGQLTVGCYMWDEERGRFAPGALDVLTLTPDGRIAEVTAFLAPWLFQRFGDASGGMSPADFARFGLAPELPT